MDRSLAEVIARFVPRRVARHPLLAAPLESPHAERADGAVLFADISGFTALSEDLGRCGAQASEELTAILNDYFGRLTSIIDSHGGDVVKFAGDALLALWPGASDEARRAATWRAALCAREIQQVLRAYGVEAGRPLQLRMSIGAGPVVASFVGGVYGRWEFVVAGPPLRQVGAALAHADPGSVVLSPEAARILGSRAAGRVLADAHLELADLEPLARTSLEPAVVDARRAEHLKAFVPRAIWQRIAAGQTQWLGELRRLSSVLVNLKDLDEAIGLARAQEIMCALQRALYRYEGSVNKLSVDDKGVTLVAAFGLPPLFHEDDALRAVKSALEIEHVLEQMGVRCSIGVTTGRVYCGAVGGDVRREYTVIGRPVNVAARLMMASRAGILIDAATHAAAQRSIACDERGRLELKGLPALEVWQPRRLETQTQASSPESRLVGRASERARLRACLAELVAEGRSNVVLIQGEAGIGTSCLVGDLLAAAREAEVALFVGAADAIEKSTAYHVWRGIAAQVLDYDARASAEERSAQVLRSLGSDPELGELLPLLNGILPLEFPETRRSEQMSAETRAQNARELLLRLIQRAAKGRPIVVVIDDLHWMDSASWGVVVQLAREVAPLLLVLASRPMASPPPELAAVLARGERLELDALSQRDTLQLVASRLGVSELPPEMARLITERAEGHPLFSEEIGYALRDAGLIEIENGHCRLRGGDLSRVDLPSTVEGVITTRIDRLAPEEQLTLKVASVIGRVFRARELWSIHPMSREWDALLADLRKLDAADLTPLEQSDPQLSYIFKHVITRDVAYSLMLFAQRQELHRAAAEWYEREHGDDLAIYYPLLAHHWAGAGVDAKTVHYLERAAERALHSYANHEVVRFLREALERSGGEASLDAARRTRWESMLGEAKRGLGSYPEAGRHMESALAQLGFPIPSSTPRLLLGIVREGVRQLWRRVVPPRAAAPERAERLLQAAHLSERIFLIYFFAAEDFTMMYSGLAAVNLAQSVGRPSVTLARGYCTLQVMMASLGLQGQSRYFGARAEPVDADPPVQRVRRGRRGALVAPPRAPRRRRARPPRDASSAPLRAHLPLREAARELARRAPRGRPRAPPASDRARARRARGEPRARDALRRVAVLQVARVRRTGRRSGPRRARAPRARARAPDPGFVATSYRADASLAAVSSLISSTIDASARSGR